MINGYKRRRLMRFNITLMVVIILAAATFLYVQIPKNRVARIVPQTTRRTASIVPETVRGLPTRLKIPAIDVDAPVEYIGKTAKGDMAVPSGHIAVGWYKYGPLPGDTGSSVIAGHIVGLTGERGVFFHLDKLQTGDILQIADAKGSVASFTVRQTKTYDQTQQPSEVFNSSSGTHLNLITCAGDWDAAHRNYLKRLVVFADKIP
jgi:LPXTG-site transpeptidase (sortase) family protein